MGNLSASGLEFRDVLEAVLGTTIEPFLVAKKAPAKKQAGRHKEETWLVKEYARRVDFELVTYFPQAHVKWIHTFKHQNMYVLVPVEILTLDSRSWNDTLKHQLIRTDWIRLDWIGLKCACGNQFPLSE